MEHQAVATLVEAYVKGHLTAEELLAGVLEVDGGYFFHSGEAFKRTLEKALLYCNRRSPQERVAARHHFFEAFFEHSVRQGASA